MSKKLFFAFVLLSVLSSGVCARIFELQAENFFWLSIPGARFQPSATRTWDGGGATNNWSEAANWSDDIVPAAGDTVVFDATSTKNATLDVNVSISFLDIKAGYTGTISQGASNLTLTNGNAWQQAGGTFAGGSGTIDIDGNFNLSGGTFTASSGASFFGAQFVFGANANFNHNGGTIVWDGVSVDNSIGKPITFNNLTVAKNNGAFFTIFGDNPVVVLNDLNLNDGAYFFGSHIEARGAVNISPNFDGNGGSSGGLILVTAGSGTPRTINLAAGLKLVQITLNAANVTVNTSGTGTLDWQILNLQAGTINQADTVDFVFNSPGGNIPYTQTGGTFNGSVGSMTFNGGSPTFRQTGGSFNGSSGDIDINGRSNFTGGTFTASSGSTFFSDQYTRSAGAAFNHNNGTVVWDGAASDNSPGNNLTLNNFVFNKNDNQLTTQFNGSIIVLGTATFNDGIFNGGGPLEFQARGNVTVGTGFDGGLRSIALTGAGDQTFTNNGGINPQGTWTLDKSGGTVNLATDLDLSTAFANNGAILALTNGTITTGNFVVNAGLLPITRANGYINGKLRRAFNATGTRLFPVGTANGFSPVTANVTSLNQNPSSLTVGAVQAAHPQLNPAISLERFWTIAETGDAVADLTFNYLQTDVRGSEASYKVNRIANGNVEILTTTLDTAANTGRVFGVSDFNADWTLSATAPPLQISPSSASANAGNQIAFAATGGTAPYSFSLLTNNSGGSINPLTGVYTAGATFGVTDTVRVTDASGGTADASVSVLAPFTVVNTNDAGAGSLRQALQNANATPGAQTVTFDIPGSAPHTIQISLPLGISDGTNIDGSTQPGYAGSPVIEIDGGGITPGTDALRLFGSGGTIKSLVINRLGTNAGAAIAALSNGSFTIQNCYLGTDATGTVALGNGVGILGISNSLIGGSRQLNQGNIISGNRLGIDLGDGNTVKGNYIGTNPNGDNLGNGTGIIIFGNANNTIGGIDPNEANTIAYSSRTDNGLGDGISIFSQTATITASNRIQGNSIFQNTDLGIDLSPDGVTPNDTCDADTGPNDLQNFPVIASAFHSGGSIQIQGTLNSRPNQTFQLDFYLSLPDDASANGFGRIYLGSANVATGADCNASFNLIRTFGSASFFPLLTATATDASGNTSEFSAPRALTEASPLVVTNTNDAGVGSLREAIIAANSTPGTQTISFGIFGTAPFTINVNSELPEITEPVTIDGTTQPGFAGTPIIELRSASGFQNGLRITGGGSTVKGLVINGFGSAITLRTGGGNTIQGNRIGTNVAGSAALQNLNGIIITGGSSNNLIGGANAGARNLISGNVNGIEIQQTSSNNTIQNNFIGTNAAGTAAIGNINQGIRLRGSSNTIAGNVISGNLSGGVIIGGSIASGGSSGTQNNIVQNNLIGLNADGTAPIFNIGHGILIFEAQSRRNRLSANRIFGNTGMGIKISNTFSTSTAVLLNDPQDADTGANDLQNYPVLNSFTLSSNAVLASGSLNSTPSSTFRVEFFSSPTCDLPGVGSGERFLGFANVTTDAGGIAAFNSVPLPLSETVGRFVTATATDADGNTSEFSRCQQALPLQISGSITNASGQPASNVLVQLTNPTVSPFSRSVFTNSNGNFGFTNLAPADYTLTPSSPLNTFTPQNRFYPNLNTSQSNQNFTAAPRGSILGRARTNVAATAAAAETKTNNLLPPAPAGGFPLLGVSFNVTGNNVNQTITNDSFGNYRFGDLAPGTYTVTPSKPNYTFTPSAATVTVGNGEVPLDFVGESLGLSTLTGRIVFDSAGDIFTMNADGSNLVTLASASTRTFTYSSPSLSGSGERAVFLRRRVNSTSTSIVTSNADGSRQTVVLTNANGLASPVFSLDGSRIAYNDSQNRLFTINADGSGNQQINGSCADADWSPDNQKLVCADDNTILLINLAQTTAVLLDNSTGQKFSPRFSPDGTRLAFIRRQSGTPATHSIVVKTLAGNLDQTILSGTTNLYRTLAWSPDGARLAFTRQATNKQLVTVQTDGQNLLIINNSFPGDKIDWSARNVLQIVPGAKANPVMVESGRVSITFPDVSNADAFAVITPIAPASAGNAPAGYALGSYAVEISTNANFTPPAQVCFNLDDIPVVAPRILHRENEALIDITTGYDSQTNTVCGAANSFSPFVLAEQIDANLPSITGLVLDSGGNPLSNVAINLTGAENRQTTTDSNGIFHFVNLTAGANYNVQPYKTGFLFTEYSQDFVNLSGEQTVVFRGAARNFQIGGRVTNGNGNGVSGVQIKLEGAESAEILTDANGDYLFAALPADGSFVITPSNGGNSFAPAQIFTGALTDDLSGADFVQFAPTAASVSISGRVFNAQDGAISGAQLVLTDPSGRRIAARTNTFGYYVFENLAAGATYIVTVSHNRYTFANPTRVVNASDSVTDLDFTGQE